MACSNFIQLEFYNHSVKSKNAHQISGVVNQLKYFIQESTLCCHFETMFFNAVFYIGFIVYKSWIIDYCQYVEVDEGCDCPMGNSLCVFFVFPRCFSCFVLHNSHLLFNQILIHFYDYRTKCRTMTTCWKSTTPIGTYNLFIDDTHTKKTFCWISVLFARSHC